MRRMVLLASIMILAMVIIGGMGNIFGVVLSAVVLTLIPERLREFENLRMLLFGGCLVLIMIYAWIPRELAHSSRCTPCVMSAQVPIKDLHRNVPRATLLRRVLNRTHWLRFSCRGFC